MKDLMFEFKKFKSQNQFEHNTNENIGIICLINEEYFYACLLMVNIFEKT